MGQGKASSRESMPNVAEEELVGDLAVSFLIEVLQMPNVARCEGGGSCTLQRKRKGPDMHHRVLHSSLLDDVQNLKELTPRP